MNLFKYVNPLVFIISLAFGFFAVYITVPEKRRIVVYPTHENAGVLQYRDKTQTCFSIVEQEVKCPASANDLAKIPLQ
jgi:hypothetical protein